MSTVKRQLRVSLVQAPLHWHQPQPNREMFTERMAALQGCTDLIVLPEMFTTGFTMTPERVAEPEQGPTEHWLQQQAAELQAAICGSVAIQTASGYVNRMLFVSPDGEVQSYDKRHLFRMGGEHNHYLPGAERKVFSYLGWRILPLICYDLRFPVFSRNRDDYDLLLCVANWPAPRRQPWRILAQARAIENLSYVAAVNRCGSDDNGLNYSGDSLLIDFKGEKLIDQPDSEAFVLTQSLDMPALQQFRQRFPAQLDGDLFTLEL
ncbi:amidohydrolase [Marinobacterium jannaschii]|uniref:amidohydrolase n=1 Tax=Marinobacterium jannaschii TaxID=64970 RepID=UPI0004809506|nr:amidohydrolase [Marinobacterium jannaschii]